MNNLLQIDDTIKGFPKPEVAEIKEFSNLIDKADKPERLLAYIYHMESVDSSYVKYKNQQRDKKVKKDLFGDKEWKEPEYVTEAREKYIELSKSPEELLLEDAIESIHTLRDWLQEFDPTERDENGKLVWKVKDYMRSMEKMPGLIDSLDDLRERVQKGEDSEGDIRGGVKLNQFNRGE